MIVTRCAYYYYLFYHIVSYNFGNETAKIITLEVEFDDGLNEELFHESEAIRT